ncbi:MAG TPA: AraC family transcriptional regulator [Gemmatimonadaceae bacterium]|nr:AraC family transcriptional regulator [Gemmatimonadaceae bacterium]
MTAATLPFTAPSDKPDARDVVYVQRIDAFGGFDAIRATYTRHSFPPHFHSTFAIGVMTRGACALECRGGTYLLRAGHVVLIAPGEAHTGEQVGDEGWSSRVLYPSPAVVAAARNLETPASHPLRFRVPIVDDAVLARRIVSVHDALTAAQTPLEQETLTVDLVASVFGMHGEPRRERLLRHGPSMAAARDYLHEHSADGVTLTRLAGIAGLSCFYFLRLFRIAFGVTRHVYLALLRLERARAMLRTDAPLAQIAVACGFSDQSHFTRFFKRVYGITPGVYAKQVRTVHW